MKQDLCAYSDHAIAALLLLLLPERVQRGGHATPLRTGASRCAANRGGTR
jgi:hypothetical protein